MKLPRFTVRTMLIAVAIIAAAVGWARYEQQRFWTVERVERMIQSEFNPSWDRAQFNAWVESKGFYPHSNEWPNSEFDRVRDFGIFMGQPTIL